jgi:ferredoxin-thioredoxin reductase catalytic subunit
MIQTRVAATCQPFASIGKMKVFLSFVALLVLPLTQAFMPVSKPSFGRVGGTVYMAKEMTPEEEEIAVEKATKAMTAFTNKYLQISDTKLCADKSVPAVVIKGLAEHKVTLGAPLCPCRFYDDKEKEAKDGYWNCPCVPMRERQECHCMLFLTDDNDFVGEETNITFDEVIEGSQGMSM